MTLPGGRKGCSFISFSPDGNYLACGCKENETYPIVVYNVSGVIYDITAKTITLKLELGITEGRITEDRITEGRITEGRKDFWGGESVLVYF